MRTGILILSILVAWTSFGESYQNRNNVYKPSYPAPKAQYPQYQQQYQQPQYQPQYQQPQYQAPQRQAASIPGQSVWVQDSSKAGTWRNGDPTCVYHFKDLVGCGTVSQSQIGNVNVWLPQPTRDYRFGQSTAGLRLVRDHRLPSSTEEVAEKFQVSNVKTVNLSLGMAAGHNYFYPWGHAQLAVNRNWSIGISPMFVSYSRDDDKISAFGGFATVTYYYTHFAFRGVQFEGGLGFYDIKVTSGTTEESDSPMAAKLTVGWSGKALWDLGLDIGLAAGAQYIFHEPTVINSSFKGLLPYVSAYLAYNF